jgi:hypothetical protein
MKKTCENCKHKDRHLFEYPCTRCWIPDPDEPDPRDNDRWEPEDERG